MFNIVLSVLSVLTVTLVIIFSFYLLLPEIFVHILGIGGWKRQYSPGISLSFDDGPDPRYTPKILKKLAENDVKAIFFLVGEKAHNYPELVLRIRDEGHQIGAHCYNHKHAWLMTPVETWRLWEKSNNQLKDILGREPDLVRPPWGSMNLAFFIWSKLRKKKIILWNSIAQDWRLKYKPDVIVDRSLKKANEGTIVLLHDSGGDEGAPENTISALDNLCHNIKHKLKLPIVPLSLPQWSFVRRLSFRLWEKWEHYYAKTNEIRRIDHNNLFRLARTKYKGPDLYDQGGQLVAQNGDWVGEIHMDSIRFQTTEKNNQKIGLRALKLVRLSLPALTKYITESNEFKDIKVFFGRTMLNRGAKGLGFNVEEKDDNSNRLLGFLQKIIIYVYHPSGLQRDTERLGSKPKLVWITRETLINKYLPNDPEPQRKDNLKNELEPKYKKEIV